MYLEGVSHDSKSLCALVDKRHSVAEDPHMQLHVCGKLSRRQAAAGSKVLKNQAMLQTRLS